MREIPPATETSMRIAPSKKVARERHREFLSLFDRVYPEEQRNYCSKSKRSLAAELGMTPGTIYSWVNGTVCPPKWSIAYLAMKLKTKGMP